MIPDEAAIISLADAFDAMTSGPALSRGLEPGAGLGHRPGDRRASSSARSSRVFLMIRGRGEKSIPVETEQRTIS
ncbi:MAG: hypothetical protein MZV64_28980 [Ignavibacteriales bacterium]|nr:hypothetical protein [Ignavibacteriales bacterium]